MGMKCNFMVATKGDPAAQLRNLPPLDVAATDALATAIIGKRWWGRTQRAVRTGDLFQDVYPQEEIAVGVFGDLIIVAGDSVSGWPVAAVDDWGTDLMHSHDVDAFVLHSVVEMGCFASWRNGELIRAFGGSGDDGVMIDDGQPLPFERDFDLEEEGFGGITELAILDRLGFCYEGTYSPDHLDPKTVPLLVYRC